MIRRIILIGLFVATQTFAAPPMGIIPAAMPEAKQLQAVLDAGATFVVVQKGTYTLDAPLRLRSNLSIWFESGAAIEAAEGAFQGKHDSLVIAAGCENVTIQADGATFKMRKADYRDPAKYPIKSEFRHCLDIAGSKNVTVTGGTYLESGGDGIFIGPQLIEETTGKWKRLPSQNVSIRRVTCDSNHRQGISVVACSGCLVEDSILARTIGTSPQAGIDVEPEPGDPIDVTVKRCRSEANRGPAYMVSLQHLAPTMAPVRIIFESNTYFGVPSDQPSMRMTGVFSAVAPTGYLAANIPVGSMLGWNDLVWKK